MKPQTLKLSSTSALVLLWEKQECYQSKKAKQYLEQLDLESGRSLYEQCQKIWTHYDEIIKNRKFGVFHLIKQCYAKKNKCEQIIIAGAGLDALGIEITETYPDIKIFELDRENMPAKSDLVNQLYNNTQSNIKFIKADLLDPSSIYEPLIINGWLPDKPTLLIMEGISYYLTPEAIKQLIKIIKPCWTIFEFLKHDKDIARERLKIPYGIFELISNKCKITNIGRYNYSKIEKMFNTPVTDKYSMKRLEKSRTGSNIFFPTENSGWIEVCLFSFDL